MNAILVLAEAVIAQTLSATTCAVVVLATAMTRVDVEVSFCSLRRFMVSLMFLQRPVTECLTFGYYIDDL